MWSLHIAKRSPTGPKVYNHKVAPLFSERKGPPFGVLQLEFGGWITNHGLRRVSTNDSERRHVSSLLDVYRPASYFCLDIQD